MEEVSGKSSGGETTASSAYSSMFAACRYCSLTDHPHKQDFGSVSPTKRTKQRPTNVGKPSAIAFSTALNQLKTFYCFSLCDCCLQGIFSFPLGGSNCVTENSGDTLTMDISDDQTTGFFPAPHKPHMWWLHQHKGSGNSKEGLCAFFKENFTLCAYTEVTDRNICCA